MANFTLDYTGEEVNALLGQVAAGGSGGGGVMRVNVSFGGINEDMAFSDLTADKTPAEIMEAHNSGILIQAIFDMSMLGSGYMILPVTMVVSEGVFFKQFMELDGLVEISIFFSAASGNISGQITPIVATA